MTDTEHELLKEFAFRGLNIAHLVSYGYFCGEPETKEHLSEKIGSAINEEHY